MPNPALIAGLFSVGEKLIDRIIPDKEAQAKAKFELYQQIQSGELKELETRMSAIIAEAQSNDPWTSRARPSFLYVIYALLLFGVPMGFLSAYDPEMALRVADGFKAWLEAIPSDLYMLFGAGYLGYAVVRTKDKANIKDLLQQ